MRGPVREVSLVADRFSFLESPRWHAGRLYVSDHHTHRVLAIDEAGQTDTVAEVPGQPGGLGFTRSGELLVASMTDRRLLRVTDGTVDAIADLSGMANWSLNDMVVDRRGRAYVGHFGFDVPADPHIAPASLLLVLPGGELRVAAHDLVFPNGMALADDGETLLVAETFAARISAFEVADDGSLSNRRTWARFADSVGATVFEALESGLPLPDGIALDAEGCIWMGDLTGRGALRVAPGGELVETISLVNEVVYAVALGGADRRTLYLCAGPGLLDGDPVRERRARLLSCRVDVPGAGLP